MICFVFCWIILAQHQVFYFFSLPSSKVGTRWEFRKECNLDSWPQLNKGIFLDMWYCVLQKKLKGSERRKDQYLWLWHMPSPATEKMVSSALLALQKVDIHILIWRISRHKTFCYAFIRVCSYKGQICQSYREFIFHFDAMSMKSLIFLGQFTYGSSETSQ